MDGWMDGRTDKLYLRECVDVSFNKVYSVVKKRKKNQIMDCVSDEGDDGSSAVNSMA
jgi:hypothetical protein